MRIEIVLNWKMKFSMILYVVLFPTCLKAQLSAADSAYFQNVFTRPLYIDTTVNPGNWYQYSPVSSFYNHYLILDTNFTFKPHDLDSVHLLTIDDSLHDESIINTSFQANPSLLSQSDPVVSIPFHLNGKRGKAYSFLYPDTIPEPCRYAFIIVPGTGTNASYDIIRGLGYHNLLCQMVSTCRSYGDVFTFIKPNEECRAIYWNNLKLNEYIVDYLITQHTFYGITYLAEMMATIQYLKMKYDKVFLFGLSEGGYSALLASLYTEPDAALISGGYSIQFDTCTAESSILYTRFDSLVYQWNKDSLRNRIAQSKTHYLFTWGDGDPVLTMDPEHDFHYTQNFYSGIANCSWFYDFNDHTFPPCFATDSFIQRIIQIPRAHFVVTDSSGTDTLRTRVRFCTSGSYTFDLYRETNFVHTYTAVSDSIDISLTDSGRYHLEHIKNADSVLGTCMDTLWFNKKTWPLSAHQFLLEKYTITGKNPFSNELILKTAFPPEACIPFQIMDLQGRVLLSGIHSGSLLQVSSSQWKPGLYQVLFLWNEQRIIWKGLKNPTQE